MEGAKRKSRLDSGVRSSGLGKEKIELSELFRKRALESPLYLDACFPIAWDGLKR